MKLRLTLLILFLLLIAGTIRAESPDKEKKHTISGTVTDKSNGESLIGATVFVKELRTGAVTDVYGHYSLTLPGGNYTIAWSYIGYKTEERSIELNGPMTINIELGITSSTLSEVVITGEQADRNVAQPEMSIFKMNSATIERIPALFGEVDILKAIQLLPGVQSVSEGSSGFSVRGGSPDQNLIMLDEATVYNASHLLGFFSVFNNDAIKDVKLYKGDIPSSYGGRLSSVLDVRMNEGNSKEFEFNGGIGLIASRLTIEGPIIKDKLSFIVSGRRTYADLYLPLSKEEALRNNKLYFYDLNAKANYRINDRNQLFISGYFGRDVFKNQFAGMDWGNGTGTLRWNHMFSKKLFSNFTVLYSDYAYRLDAGNSGAASFVWNSSLKDLGGKGDFSLYLNTNNTLRFGFSSSYHMIDPGVAKGVGESVFSSVTVPMNYALESGIYASNEQKLGEQFTLKYGLRYSLFQNVGPGTVFNYDENYEATDSTVYSSGNFYNQYSGLEPRVGILFNPSPLWSIKASYARTYQYLQLAQNSTVGTPLDVWFPASPNIKPQLGDQVAAGYFRNFRKNTIETSVEVYYKWMNNVIDFKDFAQLLLNNKLEGEVRTGRAWSYGAEFLVKLNEKKLNGWVSYTYSRTFRQINGINGGNKYPAPYDKPHNVSVVLNYVLNPRWTFSMNWLYATGTPVTFPTGRAVVGGKVIPIYSDRNAYRYEDYNRLDVSATFYSKAKPGQRFTWDLNFSVYNVYNRHNTWTINFLQEETNPDVTYAEKVYLFGIIPSVTFNFHFNHEK